MICTAISSWLVLLAASSFDYLPPAFSELVLWSESSFNAVCVVILLTIVQIEWTWGNDYNKLLSLSSVCIIAFTIYYLNRSNDFLQLEFTLKTFKDSKTNF